MTNIDDRKWKGHEIVRCGRVSPSHPASNSHVSFGSETIRCGGVFYSSLLVSSAKSFGTSKLFSQTTSNVFAPIKMVIVDFDSSDDSDNVVLSKLLHHFRHPTTTPSSSFHGSSVPCSSSMPSKLHPLLMLH